MALRDAFADLLDTPANPANPAKTRANAGPQPDSGACESLRILRIGGSPVEKFAGFASIRKPKNTPPARANACDSQNSQDSQWAMTREQADRCHAPCWNDAEIATFTARVLAFVRRGLSATAADDMAERLTLRDREHDDRKSCVECRHGRSARCPDGAPLPAATLHRCPRFAQ